MDNKQRNITNVSEDRWQQAQKAELDLWKRDADLGLARRIKFFVRSLLKGDMQRLDSNDDWNRWWLDKFDQYSFLPKKANAAIEIGCGPFSNMRLIMKKVNCSNVYLSDPLIKEYIKHTSGFVSAAVKNGDVLIDNSPAESLPYKDDSFDLVVMINVLDHVMNAEKAMEICHRITKKGGYFVLGQDLINEDDVEKHNNMEDVYHPIRIDHIFLDNMLKGKFEPIYFKLLAREEGRNPDYHYATYVYSGQKI